MPRRVGSPAAPIGDGEQPTTPNRGGRARSEDSRLAILAATRQLLVDRGYDRLSIEGVALAAGVGKQTIYRWWPSKSALVAEYVIHDGELFVDEEVPNTTDLRADLQAWLQRSAMRTTAEPTASLLRGLIAAAAEDSRVAESLFVGLSGRTEQALIARIQASSTASDEVARVAVAAMTGAITYTLLTNRAFSPQAAADLAALIAGGLSEF